jgi:hypothetical protein
MLILDLFRFMGSQVKLGAPTRSLERQRSQISGLATPSWARKRMATCGSDGQGS